MACKCGATIQIMFHLFCFTLVPIFLTTIEFNTTHDILEIK